MFLSKYLKLHYLKLYHILIFLIPFIFIESYDIMEITRGGNLIEDLTGNIFVFMSIALLFITIFYRFLLDDYESLYWFLWELKKREK